ncbi:MAG: ATP-binding protein [bacterium]
MSITIFSMQISSEYDVVLARQRARQIAAALGFRELEQTHISTAASEITRNALMYAGGGTIEYMVEGEAPQVFLIRIRDQGPGIDNLQAILEGQYIKEKNKGMGIIGMGIVSARRLVDYFHIESTPGRGTTVLLGNTFPPGAPPVTRDNLTRIAIILAEHTPQDSFTFTIRQQHRELMATLGELSQRQEELARVNRELEDTNRGVMALYAELEEKAGHLAKADKLKSRFLSDMSHEFRTPINSILALSQILLNRIDGDLTEEQEKQVNFIHQAAQDLSTLINDLLDLSRIEAGKVTLHLNRFEVANLFSAIRGIMRPLLTNENVDLIFEDASAISPLYTDEGKVSQILRNLISNALKFTERGEVRVSAACDFANRKIIFSVEDTGIGIAPEDQERIFQEFTQLESPSQKRSRGTGLGLPLSRKLAALLGGSISLKSQPGVGSTFSVIIPVVHDERAPVLSIREGCGQKVDQTRFPVLVVEDDPETIYTYERYFTGSDFQIIPARNLKEAHAALKQVRPMAIILDILLPGENGWAFLAELKESEATWDIPVLVVSIVNKPEKGKLLGADDYFVKPVSRQRLLNKLKEMEKQLPLEKVLIIDDEEISRYLLKGLLADTRCTIIEAENGPEGIHLAAREKPQAIFLDLVMPGMNGFEVLDRLKADPETRDIPVIVITAKHLEEEERSHLEAEALSIISKGTTPRDAAMAQIKDALAKALRLRGTGKE